MVLWEERPYQLFLVDQRRRALRQLNHLQGSKLR